MRTKRRLVLVGAGGHGRVVADLVRLGGRYAFAGATDPDRAAPGRAGLPWLGDDTVLPGLRKKGVSCAALGVGSIGNTAARAALRRRLQALGFELPALAHPSALVSPDAVLGPGCQVMAGAILNPGVRTGAGVVVNTGAIVEHDCRLADDAFIGPGAVLGGEVLVEEGAFVGIGATIRQGLRVGKGALVGAGAVVVRDVPPKATVVGVPAAPVRARR